MATPSEIRKSDPNEYDYPAARSYRALLTTARMATKVSQQMKKAPIEPHPASARTRWPHVAGGNGDGDHFESVRTAPHTSPPQPTRRHAQWTACSAAARC
jgi:hypothetical protein